jgi:hypothetical protein
MRRLAVLITLALAVGVAVPAVVPGASAPAAAAARVSVSGLDGAARASTTGPTTLRLSGAGFQSVPNAFGGLYVLFGWVDGGAWAPSQGGVSGDTLRYVPDSESADNAGYQRFVAFPGSSTADEANGGLLAEDGTWSASIVVPGPRFTALDRAGEAVEVDCTQVRCGVITIGAHGVANAANETFTPVEFVGDDAGASEGSTGGSEGGSGTDETVGSEQSGAAGSGGAATGGTSGPEPSPSASADDDAGPATVGFDQATAVAGRVLSFAGQGFEPGEQVVAVLDEGELAVGPLSAGAHGEVAGLLELPDDLRLGTHVLRVTGASSGKQPEVEIVVTRDPADAAAEESALVVAAASGGGGDAGAGAWGTGYSVAELAAGAALLLLLVVVVSSAVTGGRRRRGAGAPGTEATPAATPEAFREPQVPA